MTPNEITTLIASGMDKELDVPFKLQLMERVKVWRSRLIANSLDKKPQQRKFFRQSLYLKMERTSAIPCASLIDCDVAATVAPVPLVVRAGNIMFDYVGGPDGKSPFKQLDPGTGFYLSSGRFAKNFPMYEFVNDHIVTSKVDQPLIRVDAVFDDPMEVKALSCTAQTDVVNGCDEWNMEFPVAGDIMQLIIQSIRQIDYNVPERKDVPDVNQ